ncbi:hypothetical protein MTO96_030979 [Rhipicephalus appendiculatus]
MIALKVSLAHCNGALDTMLTYIRRDCEQNGEGSRADELKKCGNQKYKDKAYQEACEYYTKAIAEMRYNHFLYSNRALSALQLQKYKEVELDARRVVILHPNFEKGYFKMAQVYESLKQISRAKKVLEYYTKRCNFMSLDFSREIQDLHKRLTETGEKVKNGKADTKNSQPATNKPKAKPAVPDLTSSDTDKEMKDILKKSCDDLVVGLYKVALQGFKKVLAQKPNLTELDVVLVEYAAGCALLGMGSLEDLKNSVEYFLGIVSNHKDVVFPLAYYGVSKALIKMNRFSEALPHIEKCLSILQKGIQFSETLLWPETKTKVDNAKRPQLQKAMEEMQALCRAPPKWDAMCCYEACPLQKTIYYSDPDFKGFQQVHCASKCLVQYHPACWREYRESRNLTEKGFLGEACPTPDCCGVVVKVEAIEKDGTVGKQFVHTQLLVETAPKQKKTKGGSLLTVNLALRLRNLELTGLPSLGRRRNWNSENKRSSNAAPPSLAPSSQRMIKMRTQLWCRALLSASRQAAPLKTCQRNPRLSEPSHPRRNRRRLLNKLRLPLPRGWKPLLHCTVMLSMYLKKTKASMRTCRWMGEPRSGRGKGTNPCESWSWNPVTTFIQNIRKESGGWLSTRTLLKSTVTGGPFCQRQKEMIPELDPENPFYIPEGLRHNEAALEAVLQHHGSGYADESSDVNETIYQLFEDLIESKGPISIHDKLLASEVMNFPEPAQQAVARAGGLQSFLLRSLRFTFDGDMVYTARMRPRGPSLYKPDEISLPDEGSDYEEEDECEESDEEEECDEEEANEYDSSRYIETMGQAASNPSASVASGDTTPNPSAMLMKAITCNLNPNAKAFELPLDALATGSQSGDAQPPSSSTKLLVALPQKQLGECLVLAVNSFRGPLSLKTLATINNGLEHCKLCNKAVVQDFGVQVEQSIEYLEERDALVEKIKELACENARIKEQLESALDYNVQMASKNTLETSKYKEKIEDLNRELQTSRQNAKKSKLESDAEIKRLQQERVKLKEENKLLKTSRNEDNMKETLDKTITEFAKLKSKSDDLEETCRVLEEASDNALERAKRAEVRILETAHKWGLERFDRSKKHVQKVLKEMEGLKASLDPNSLAELVRKERLADLYLIEWTKEYEQFERKVQDHIGKVERGQALADLEVIDLPAKPDFEITLPKPSLLPLPRQQAPRPFAPVQDVPMAARPKVPSFPAPAPLFSHPPGIMLPPSTAAAAAPVPKAVPPMVEIPTGPRALSSAGTARPVHLGAPGAAPPPGLGPHYHAAAAPMPTANGEIAMAVSAQALTPPGYPAAASRPAEKAGNEAPGQSHRSEKLMQKLMERYPGCSREEIKAALKRVYEAKGFKGLTIADIIKDTSDVLDKTFPHARAANTQAEEEHKVPARAPQFAVPQPKPRLVLKAMRPSQSAMSQPQPPPPVPPQQKTWTSHHEPRQSWNGRATQCSICLDDLNGQTQEIRTSCGHCFHEKCLQKWFKTDHTCPNCRAHTLSDKDFPTLG